jgi:hypothetical protein
MAMKNPKAISFTSMAKAMLSKGLIIRNATIMTPMKISRLIMTTTSLVLVAGHWSLHGFMMNTAAIKAVASFSHSAGKLIAAVAITLRVLCQQ